MATTPPPPRAQKFLFYVALLNKQASRYLRLKSERTVLKLYFYVTLFLAGLKTIWNVYTKKATRVSLPGTFLSIFLLLAQFTSAYANACYVRRVELISPLCLYLSRACSTCTTITDKATKKNLWRNYALWNSTPEQSAQYLVEKWGNCFWLTYTSVIFINHAPFSAFCMRTCQFS